MSLINEALKRAETDKLRNSPYFNNLTVLPPVDAADDEFPPPPRPAFHEPRRRGLPVVSAIAGAMIFAGLIGGGYVYLRLRGQTAPQTVVAAKPPTPAALPKGAAAAPTPREVSPPAELAFARTLASVQYYQPPPKPTAPPPAAPAAAEAPAVPATPQAPPAPAANPPAAAAGPVKPAAARPVQPAPTTAVRPPRQASSADAARRRFRLSAVMSGPAGHAALINGELLREGQTIEGAEVLHIGPHHAELELDGQRFTVRLSN